MSEPSKLDAQLSTLFYAQFSPCYFISQVAYSARNYSCGKIKGGVMDYDMVRYLADCINQAIAESLSNIPQPLSMRDQFAMSVIASFVASHNYGDRETYVQRAYEIADLMLEVRKESAH
jgi:hypothetical protein